MTKKQKLPEKPNKRLDRKGFLQAALGATMLAASSAHAEGITSGVAVSARPANSLVVAFWDGRQLRSLTPTGEKDVLNNTTVRVTVTPSPAAAATHPSFRSLNAHFSLPTRSKEANVVQTPFYAWTAPTTSSVSFRMPVTTRDGLTFSIKQGDREAFIRLGGDGLPLHEGTYLIAETASIPSLLLLRMETDATTGRLDIKRPLTRTRNGFLPSTFEYLVLHIEEDV